MDAHGASIGGVQPADALLELWKCLQWEELARDRVWGGPSVQTS